MTVSLIASIEQLDNGGELMSLVLPDLTRGISHTAIVGRGDMIHLPCNVTLRVTNIVHHFQPAYGTRLVPESEAFTETVRLGNDDIVGLRGDGFTDL